MLTVMMILREIDILLEVMSARMTTVVMVVMSSGKMMRRRRKMFSDWRTWQFKRYQWLPVLRVEAKALL